MVVLEGGIGRPSATFRIIGVINTQEGWYFDPFSLVAGKVMADTPIKFGLAYLFQAGFIPLGFAHKAIKARWVAGSKQGPIKTGYILTAIIDNEGNKQSSQMAFSWFSQFSREEGKKIAKVGPAIYYVVGHWLSLGI
jgi:hypothetical protein